MHVESTVDLAIKLISSALTGIYNELPFSCIKSYELLWIVLFIISKENMLQYEHVSIIWSVILSVNQSIIDTYNILNEW